MRALVTGADGFVGRHLIRHLLAGGDDVFAVTGPSFSDEAIEEAPATPLDVTDGPALVDVVKCSRPEVIYHLAAIASAGDREQTDAAIAVNVIGSLNALRAAAALPAPARLILVSSAMVYGGTTSDKPLTEESDLVPTNLYGASKVAAERACAALAENIGVDLVVARPFNHTGPGQTTQYAVPSFAAQIAAVRRGDTERIKTGPLDAVRDLSDVRDVVCAYRLMASVTPGTYNVAAGRGLSMRTLLERMLRLADLEPTSIDAPATVHGSEPSILIGDAGELRARTGWEPAIELDTTLRDVLLEQGAID